MKTIEQLAEKWVQNKHGAIAHKFCGDTEFRPHPCIEAFLAGAKAQRELSNQGTDEALAATLKTICVNDVFDTPAEQFRRKHKP